MMTYFVYYQIGLVILFIMSVIALNKNIKKKDLKIALLEKEINNQENKNKSPKKIMDNGRRDYRVEIYHQNADITILECDDERFKQIINKKFSGNIKDLSNSGLKFLSMYNLPVKGKFKVLVEFTIHNEEFNLRAFIVRKEEHLKENLVIYGLQFVEMNRKTKERLAICLHKIEAERRKNIS